MQWWFCLRHLAVEQGAGCADESRLGPYGDEQTAREALARMAQRERDQQDVDSRDADGQ